MRDADSRSLETLVRGLEDRIRAAAGRFSLQESDVDEVIQDVRIRVWKARGREGGRIEDTSAAYVYRTAVTAALDLIRHRRRRRTETLSPSLPAAGRDHPERALEAGELGTAIAESLEGIAERRRPVVRMYLAGYGSGEIADLMGWSEATARNLLYRGLEDLRRALSARGIRSPDPLVSESPPGRGTSSGVETHDSRNAPTPEGGTP